MGALTGVVQDPDGAPIASAKVVAQKLATGQTFSVTTDARGTWRLFLLPPGSYQVTFEAQGFRRLLREGVTVEATVVGRLDEKLALGTVQEEMTVRADVKLVDTHDATDFRQFNSTELQQVPSSTRNFTHLLSAEAGISNDLPPVSVADNGAISPSVSGQRKTSNSLYFNGIDATNLLTNEGSLVETVAPAPETLQEVKVQTSLYDAATGRNGGGNFQLVTQSGGNDFHGSVYWFIQNEALSANDFFFNRDGVEKPRGRRNEWGGTIGGPVVRDKLFFFASYQRTDAQTAFVPTGSSITELPAALNLISGPRTADNLVAAFSALNPGFTLTPAQISPIALNIFNLVNPATGGFVIPAPASGSPAGTDAAGNPLVEIRQAFPSQFDQDQVNTRMDWGVTSSNRLTGAFYFSNFPSLDSFPDPSSLASPFVERRNNKARTFSLADVHNFGTRWINEARFGFLWLGNTRRLNDPYLPSLGSTLSNADVGVPNPAVLYDSSDATTRLGHYVARGFSWSMGGPNDSFNKRDQRTYQLSDSLLYTTGRHTLRFGAELKRHRVANNLPEEQATEFEKFNSFTQLLQGLATEADTQFGITDKSFTATDIGWFAAYDWKARPNLTMNFGLRWDWFGWPVEKDGRIGNFDPTLANTEDPINGFLVASNVAPTGFFQIDDAVAVTANAGNKHTLNGQDLDNFQPRLGLAWSPFGSQNFVIRAGYGIFFDRPSAAFINTLFSNYPFLREIEVTFPSNTVPLATAFAAQPTNLSFNNWLPMRAVFRGGAYEIRDNTGVTGNFNSAGVFVNNPPCEPLGLSAGGPCLGNIAETFEFRAVDRNLETPYIQQWSVGYQWEFGRNFLWEVRYNGAKGTNLLLTTPLAQPFDLNSSNTPDYIFARLNQAYLAAGSPRGPLNPGATARQQGTGVAFGFTNPLTGQLDLNLGQPCATASTSCVIGFESRAPFLGLNSPEALILQSRGNSTYHALQTSLTKRFSHGLQFNLSYTWAKAIDDFSSDPGSTAGGGKPDVPNLGFQIQGDTNNLRANRALSDFDRTHRFSASFVYDIPTGTSQSKLLQGWQVSGFLQLQSGAPYSITTSEPEARTTSNLQSLDEGSGGLYRLAFGRPNLVGTSIDALCQSGADQTVEAFETSLLASPLGGFGNLPRNPCRGDMQKRLDFAVSKTTSITEGTRLEFRAEFFNIFNFTNFALPVSDLQEASNVARIENTIGGARVIQFGLRFTF
jgi:hypothetical protein